MADEIGSMAGRMAGKAALKAFINPSLDIIKVIPQGIIELVLRGAAVVIFFFVDIILKFARKEDRALVIMTGAS